MQINFIPPQIEPYRISSTNPLTQEVDEMRPVFVIRMHWLSSGNTSNIHIWQVHPEGWNYYDDCKNNGRLLECRDLTWLLWEFGISDAAPEIEDIIRSNVEWI